jgi:hypothetical protein
MSDYDRRPTTVVNNSGSGVYFIIGALVVAVLVGAYVLIGSPGLHSQVANAPGQPSQKVDITVQQPAKPAPAAPAAPATPAPATPR